MRINKVIVGIVFYLIMFWLFAAILMAFSATVKAKTPVFQKPSMECYNVLTNNLGSYEVHTVCYDNQLSVVCYITGGRNISCVKL